MAVQASRTATVAAARAHLRHSARWSKGTSLGVHQALFSPRGRLTSFRGASFTSRPDLPAGTKLGQWLGGFRADQEATVERAAKAAAKLETLRLAKLAEIASIPPVPVQHPASHRVMPRIFGATQSAQLLKLCAEEGHAFGWFTALETLQKLVKLEGQAAVAAAGRNSTEPLDRADPRLVEVLELATHALEKGAMTSTFRLGRASTDLSDLKTALEALGLDHTPCHTAVLAVIEFEGDARVTKETEGRPGEM